MIKTKSKGIDEINKMYFMLSIPSRNMITPGWITKIPAKINLKTFDGCMLLLFVAMDANT